MRMTSIARWSAVHVVPLLSLVRPHRRYTDAAYCYIWNRDICLLVGLSVSHDCKPYKTAEPTEMLVVVVFVY